MTNIIPRYEFRAFGLEELDPFIELLRQKGSTGPVRDISEIYLMTAGNTENNIKIRNKRLDIKVLVRQDNGLEQWNPREIGEFPLNKEIIRGEIFPALGVEAPFLEREVYTLKQFMRELVLDDPDIIVALTAKKRFAVDFMGCICEYALVKINGALMKTLAVESENPALVHKAVDALGMDKFENINYPKAIKRVLGLEIDYDINRFF